MPVPVAEASLQAKQRRRPAGGDLPVAQWDSEFKSLQDCE